ncbi:hypothetical protein MRX96_014635 [Rhipicephalus microplus]
MRPNEPRSPSPQEEGLHSTEQLLPGHSQVQRSPPWQKAYRVASADDKADLAVVGLLAGMLLAVLKARSQENEQIIKNGEVPVAIKACGGGCVGQRDRIKCKRGCDGTSRLPLNGQASASNALASPSISESCFRRAGQHGSSGPSGETRLSANACWRKSEHGRRVMAAVDAALTRRTAAKER